MVKKLILSLGALFISIVFIFCTSFSWFIDDNTKKTTIDGSTPTAYYKSGDGSKDNPYIIAKPIHLYNFAWLQYMGTYNKTDSDGNLIQTYFKIESDDTDESGNAVLDMSNTKYSVLPPIGTEANPFVGNFDGNNTIIKGLTTSSNSSDFKTMPATVSTTDYNTTNQVHLLGFFGYIGEASTDYTGYETSINTVSNLYIDNYTVKNTNTSNVLVGLLAGYANAQINNSGVISAQFDLISGTTSYSNYEKISKYTLVGDYNEENFNWSGKPDSGSGSDTGWGGSIDFESLNQRLTYIMANSTKSSYNYTSSFNTNIYYTSSTAFNVTSTSLQTAILNSGTYLPLNVDSSKITEENYKTATSESVLSTNTGYIVGEGSGSNGYLRSMHNKTNKDNSVINCSFYTLNSAADSPSRANSLASSNISFLWLTNEGKTYRIRDDDNKDNVSKYTIPSKYNTSYSSGSYEGIMNSSTSDTSYAGLNLVKYNDVKSNFISSLTAATTETFYGTKCYLALNYLQLKTKTVPTSTTYDNVTLNGTTGSYDLFSGGINYTLKQDGYMSMLCGMSYQGSGERGNLPDIYYVDSSSGTKTLKKIYKIIKKNGKTSFKFDDSSLSSDETLVFDLNKMSTGTLMEVGGIYYFEFPMIAGDYFMTRYDSSTSVYVPYIYYLDIGANAGDSGDTTPDEDKSPIDFVYFNSSSKLVPIQNQNSEGSYTNNSNYVYSDAYFEVSGTSTSAIKVQFKRTLESGTTETITLYYYFTADASVTITPNKSDVATNSSSELIGGN
jgi:hypothetical protein